MSRRSQTSQIRQALWDGRELTAIDALESFGCFRLAARIEELRQLGMNIETQWENDLASGKRYARYKLHRPSQAALPCMEETA